MSRSASSGYAQICGRNNLRELWLASHGVTLDTNKVIAWKGQIAGEQLDAISNARAPLYGVDGSNFRGRNVISCDRVLNNGFARKTFATPLGINANDLGYLFVIGRVKTQFSQSSGDWADIFCATQGETTSTYFSQVNFEYSLAPDSNQLVVELYCSQDNFHVFPTLGTSAQCLLPSVWGSCGGFGTTTINSNYRNAAVSSTFPQGLTRRMGRLKQLGIGADDSVPRRGNSVIAAVGWCWTPLTDSQRAALASLSAAEWGTPPA